MVAVLRLRLWGLGCWSLGILAGEVLGKGGLGTLEIHVK